MKSLASLASISMIPQPGVIHATTWILMQLRWNANETDVQVETSNNRTSQNRTYQKYSIRRDCWMATKPLHKQVKMNNYLFIDNTLGQICKPVEHNFYMSNFAS